MPVRPLSGGDAVVEDDADVADARALARSAPLCPHPVRRGPSPDFSLDPH